MVIQVKKRNGAFEAFDADKVNKVVKWACDGVSGVHEDDVCASFKTNIRNKISTKEIHEGLIDAAKGLIKESTPNYEIVAANLLNYHLRKEVWGGKDSPDFLSVVKKGVKEGRYTPEILEFFTEDEIKSFGNQIEHSRDFKFKWSGLAQAIDKYLVKNVTLKKVYETPNIAYMLIAMCLFAKEKQYIKEAYDFFSLHSISLPTPVFAGVRTTLKSFSSCCLLDMGDSTNSICAGFEAIAKATAKRYGIGVNMTKMRSIGAPIRGGESLHTGKVAFLRTIQDTIKTWMQSSTRSGAATITVPIWDYEIEEIIQLKDIMRPAENRVGDIDYSIAFSKIFYDRWQRNENITLFSSHEVPELEENYGLPSFDELYVKAENNPNIRMKKTVNARDLFTLFNRFRIETGRLYILNIDHANSHSSFKDRASMGNLCVSGDTKVKVRIDGSEQSLSIQYLEQLFNENIKIEALSYNFANGVQEYKQVENISLAGINKRVISILKNNKCILLCTTEHKVYTQNRGLIKAGEIQDADLVIFEHGSESGLEVFHFNSLENVFDITVKDNHNFYANSILVSNCQEVVHPTIPFENLQDAEGLIGVCILAAIVPTNIKNDEELERACFIAVRMLENVIDYQTYFSVPAEIFATKFRSLGIGIMNFSGWLAKKGLKYSSSEARDATNEWMEKFQYYLLKASNALAKERGACEYFHKTKYSDGVLPIDTYQKTVDNIVTSELKQDWDKLRADIKEFGLRNSTVSCFMPGEASALCTNSNNGIERPRSKFVVKSNKTQDFPVVTPNFWKWKYEYAFENETNEDHIKMMAVIQKYCDMSISTNLYYNYSLYPNKTIPAKIINKDMALAHYYGLKTIYYTNTDDGNVHNVRDESGCESGACAI